MSIWFHEFNLDDLHRVQQDTMSHGLGIEFTQIGEDFLIATMPVNARTKQPAGILHGGASCVLAETLGSFASALYIDRSKYYSVGLEINANHIKSVSSGLVTGITKPIHLGNRTHLWEIKIYNDDKNLVCIARLTVIVLPHEP